MQVPEVKGEVQKESVWGSRMRYAKIGAAAVGGGALLAVTGTHIERIIPHQAPIAMLLRPAVLLSEDLHEGLGDLMFCWMIFMCTLYRMQSVRHTSPALGVSQHAESWISMPR